jgi:predicted Fe-Mo cluster-binding NifX family protein
MKIAIQTNDKETVGENFGRALYYAVYDTETGKTVFLSNEENAGAAHGVGIQAAALMSREGVETVLSYHVGPKAGDILRKARRTLSRWSANRGHRRQFDRNGCGAT